MRAPVAVPQAEAPLAAATAAGEASASQLDGRHSGDLLRLQRLLEPGDGFQLVFALYVSTTYRQLIIDGVRLYHPAAEIIDLQQASDPSALFDELRQRPAGQEPIHLVGVEGWLHGAGVAALRALNYRRESLAAARRGTLVVWLEPGTVARFAHDAPDLWAWRAAVLDFSHPPEPRAAVHEQRLFIGGAERDARERRLAEIDAHLQGVAQAAGPDASLLLEASEIEEQLGRLQEATENARKAATIFRSISDRRGEALAAGRLADILESRGELDEALRIRSEEELPTYERLGDARSKAMTQGKIADILRVRGRLDEALRIFREEVLASFERLGDVRSKAVTQGRIADILQLRGQFDEALRLLREEALEVFERLGDLRSKAVAQGEIADILRSRGQFDEALSLLRDEVLEAHERLGDVRSKAVTQGQIADILQARGQLDEALRIRVEEELPVFERLGDVRSKAVTQGRIADILQARGQLDEALRLLRQEVLEVFERLGDVRSKAVTQGKIVNILQARGQFDEALALNEERLPIAERMGDIDSIAHIKWGTALIRLQLGQHRSGGLQRIRDDLEEAFALSRQLGRPDFIAGIGVRLAQVLAMAGDREQELQVLALAEDACAQRSLSAEDAADRLSRRF